MHSVDYDNADAFVSDLQSLGINVEWEGWQMRFLNRSLRAQRDPQGIRQRGEWGFPTTVGPNSDGLWLVHERYSGKQRGR